MDDTAEPTDGTTNTPGSGEAQSEEKKKAEEGIQTKPQSTNTTGPKKKKKEIDLPITPQVSGVSKEELELLIKRECAMIAEDKKEKERLDIKNAVEGYVNDMREKLHGGHLEKYVNDNIRKSLLNDLENKIKWLYDEGMNQEKSVYAALLKSLEDATESIRNRYNEAENRKKHMKDLMKSIQQIHEAIQTYYTKSSDKYLHIDQSDIEKVNKILTIKQTWYSQADNYFTTLEKHDDPTILCSQIRQQRDTLEKECWAILNKPKPKVESHKEDSSTQ
ncbi:unnamed protein product [Rotaria sp. Silwood2]|nr:unnamed protein product [Rotaria sp. Silwood2]